ncbi:MAG: hypothetical protein V3W41_07620 [Planctomycetota bacterium]
MKKWLIIGLVVVVGVVGSMTVVGFMGVRANDSALEEIRDNKRAVVLKVSGMT